LTAIVSSGIGQRSFAGRRRRTRKEPDRIGRLSPSLHHAKLCYRTASVVACLELSISNTTSFR
jgi:hypothetical protein